MTAKDVIRVSIGLGQQLAHGTLEDLSDADLLVRTSPSANHIAWQLGHLIASERGMVAALGHKMPELPAGFEQRHSKETASLNDAKQFGTKAEYLALLAKVSAATLAALDATPDADLDKPGPENMRAYAPTVGAVFHLTGAHIVMHAGQFTSVRRKLGKPVLF